MNENICSSVLERLKSRKLVEDDYLFLTELVKKEIPLPPFYNSNEYPICPRCDAFLGTYDCYGDYVFCFDRCPECGQCIE